MNEMYKKIFVKDVFENVVDPEGKPYEIPAALAVTGYANENDPFIPGRNPDYVFRQDKLQSVLAFLIRPHNDALYVSGPTGSGKTSLITEIAARLNWPVQQVTLNGRFEFSDLLGKFKFASARPGEPAVMRYEYGQLARAMKCGHILILNEVDMADPAELAGLNDVLEGRPVVITENGGEIIKPHPMFRVVATANSRGTGDTTGLYCGVQQMNIASMDRYRFITVGYPQPEAELEILKRVAGTRVSEEVLKSMLSIAQNIRKAFLGEDGTNGQISTPLSTRALVRWVQLSCDMYGAQNAIKLAMEQTLLDRCDSTDRNFIESQCKATFGRQWDADARRPAKAAKAAKAASA